MPKKEGFIAKFVTAISGQIHVIEQEFDRLEDAVEAGLAAAYHTFKVYDHHGHCHHHHHHGHGHHHGHHPYC